MLVLGHIFPSSPLRLDYLPDWGVITLFIVLAIPVIQLGRATIRWQGPGRGWTTVGVRLAAIWVLVLLIGGARWERQNRDVEVIVLRDVSASVASVPHAPGASLIDAEDEYLKTAAEKRRRGDRIGVISFDHRARIDALPDTKLKLGARSAPSDAGTNIASAIQLALATFRGDAMRRLVLISDGNATQGDLTTALDGAAGAGVTVDVVPLRYSIDNDVMVDRLIAPTLRRETDTITLQAVLRSMNRGRVDGRLSISDRGVQLACVPVRLEPGVTSTTVKLPPLCCGVHSLSASFEPASPAHDRLAANNSAEAITFVRGRPRVLYVDGVSGSEGELLPAALRRDGILIDDADRITPTHFPAAASDLQAYDAVILANVPRGTPDGLNLLQERALIQYVRDFAGGLLVVGGPQALGPGRWQGSELETILPVNVQPAPRRQNTPAALVIVLDRSASMADPMGGTTKQKAANAAAIRAIESLSPGDCVGVIAFNTTPQWVVPLAVNAHVHESANNINTIAPTGGTSMAAALHMAADALMTLPPERARVRHIVLLSDGWSQPTSYDQLLAKMFAGRVTMSTVAVGGDSDRHLLAQLARRGGGASYGVNDATNLCDAFVREAQSLRRPLIFEPAAGIDVLAPAPLPPLAGMVLTDVKPNGIVQVPVRADNAERDPILARWQHGLGNVAVFTADASPRWANAWIKSPAFATFWPRTMRSILRTPNNDFDVRTVRDGPRTRLIAEAIQSGGVATNFLSFTGRQSGARSGDVQLQQTGPGGYEAMLDTPDPGSYFVTLNVQGPSGNCGTLLAGAVVSSAAELRSLQSDEALLTQAATRTGGRVLSAFDPNVDLFTREGLRRSSSSQPIQDVLLLTLMGMVVIDVAVRRLALDWQHSKELFAAACASVQGFFSTRSIESRPTLWTLRQARRNIDQKLKATGEMIISTSPPIQAPPPQHIPMADERGYAVSLKAAKMRAREQIHQLELSAGQPPQG